MADAAGGGTEQAPGRTALGKVTLPIKFGEQVIVSILYNHDANPVHHRPDHAVQWMMALLSRPEGSSAEGLAAGASAEERVYALGSQLLARPEFVVMPGIVLAAICYERFVPASDVTASLTTTFTYPLLVPTKGAVDVDVEAWEGPATGVTASSVPGARTVVIEAFGPSAINQRVRLMKLEALVYPAAVAAETVFEKVVAPQFAELQKLKNQLPGFPALAHKSSISIEDRRRYSRIVDPAEHGTDIDVRPISVSAWQCKIPRVLTEVIDHFRHNANYQAEVGAYYTTRADEAERREAIRRYVEKERKYKWLSDGDVDARVEYLAQLQQHLYARQHTVFDPRMFRAGGAATAAGAQIFLDLQLYELKLRRAIHRFYTSGRLNDEPVFMGEAMVTAQPLVTRELANLLCEINHNFSTLRLFTYK